MAALAVAMKAKARVLSADDVADMVNDAGELLLADHPVRIAITQFALGYELHAARPDEVHGLGVNLHAAIARALRPDPPDLHRKDIHG